MSTFPVTAANSDSLPTEANPYQTIGQRNAFGLHDPASVTVASVKQNPPEMDVRLSGIVTVFAQPRVILSTKDPGTLKPEYHTLTEGQRAGVLEVLEIDARNERVKIRLAGVLRVLDFKSNGNPSVYVAPEMTPTSAELPAAPLGNQATSPRRRVYRDVPRDSADNGS